MERVSTRARWTFALLLVLAGLAVAGAQGPRTKNASGCALVRDTFYNNGYCDSGSGGCYYCEYSDPNGTFACNEAPNPADGIRCYPLTGGWGGGGGGGGCTVGANESCPAECESCDHYLY
jgi:hypothetical protein